MFKAYLCPQSSALFQECNQVPVYKASMPTSAGPVLVCLHSCVHRALLLKGTGYDEDAWESCRHGEFLLSAQSTGSQGLRTLALVSSLTPTQPRMDISKGLPATKSHSDLHIWIIEVRGTTRQQRWCHRGCVVSETRLLPLSELPPPTPEDHGCIWVRVGPPSYH